MICNSHIVHESIRDQPSWPQEFGQFSDWKILARKHQFCGSCARATAASICFIHRAIKRRRRGGYCARLCCALAATTSTSGELVNLCCWLSGCWWIFTWFNERAAADEKYLLAVTVLLLQLHTHTHTVYNFFIFCVTTTFFLFVLCRFPAGFISNPFTTYHHHQLVHHCVL